MNKKEEEKIILQKFIKAYHEQVNSATTFNILELKEAKKYFPNYTGEKPDFLVLINGEYIGVELFNLINDNLEPIKRNMERKNKNFKNIAHLYEYKKKQNNYMLLPEEDLARVAFCRINDKIQNKLKNYVNCPIWLIGHAERPYNFCLLSSYFEDKTENKVATHIAENVIKNDRISNIWLVEFSKNNLLLKIK